eukprot:scaffold23084_cov33-Tisochrysis_lutea.AAC.3
MKFPPRIDKEWVGTWRGLAFPLCFRSLAYCPSPSNECEGLSRLALLPLPLALVAAPGADDDA